MVWDKDTFDGLFKEENFTAVRILFLFFSHFKAY